MDKRYNALPLAEQLALRQQAIDDVLAHPEWTLAQAVRHLKKTMRLTTAEVAWINRLWHQLTPWPDAVPGLTRLRQGYPVCALSNGNVSLLLDMARHAGLPWDMLFGADLFKRYKPAAEVYLGACALLDLQPEQVMLCAAHNGDLQAAKELGLATAFIQRPREKGPAGGEVSSGGWDLEASDLQDLADQLGMAAIEREPAEPEPGD